MIFIGYHALCPSLTVDQGGLAFCLLCHCPRFSSSLHKLRWSLWFSGGILMPPQVICTASKKVTSKPFLDPCRDLTSSLRGIATLEQQVLSLFWPLLSYTCRAYMLSLDIHMGG